MRGAPPPERVPVAGIDLLAAAVLFQGGSRRSEAAALRWADVRYLKNGCAQALRDLRARRRVHARTARTLEHHQGGSMSTANNYVAALQGRAIGRRPTAASRQGRRHVGAYVPPATARQLRVIAAQEDTSTQALIEQAIEMLFRSRSRAGR